MEFSKINEYNNNNQNSIFEEKWSWVDKLLEERYYSFAITEMNTDEFQSQNLLDEKYAWVDKKLEEMMK